MKDRDEFPMILVANKADLDHQRTVSCLKINVEIFISETKLFPTELAKYSADILIGLLPV